jgi:DNA-binding CsgD family transcriptional regulator
MQVNENSKTGAADKSYKNKVGKKPVFQKVENRLEDLTEYASQQISNNEIAALLCISRSSFYKLLSENAAFKDAYKKGMENRKYELERKLFERAEGFTSQEVKIEKDPEGNVIREVIIDKQIIPDTTALIFALKNLYPEKYKDKTDQINTFEINIRQIQNLSDEELLRIAGSIDIPIDFEIK